MLTPSRTKVAIKYVDDIKCRANNRRYRDVGAIKCQDGALPSATSARIAIRLRRLLITAVFIFLHFKARKRNPIAFKRSAAWCTSPYFSLPDNLITGNNLDKSCKPTPHRWLHRENNITLSKC